MILFQNRDLGSDKSVLFVSAFSSGRMDSTKLTKRNRNNQNSGNVKQEEIIELTTTTTPDTISNTTSTTTASTTTGRRIASILSRGISVPFPTLRQLILTTKQQQEETANTSSSSSYKLGLSVQESIIAISLYLALGVVSYHFGVSALDIQKQPWSIIDALYFSVVTFTTVGYGDLTPKTTVGKIFTVMFALGGIAILGTAIATIGSKFIQTETEMTQYMSQQRLIQFWSSDNHDNNNKQSSTSSSSFWQQTVLSLFKTAIPAITALLLGGIWMGQIEGWSLVDSIYYSFITASTLGFGDISPSSTKGRLLAIVFIPLAVATTGEILGNIASTLMERRQQIWYQHLLEQDLSMNQLLEMDTNKNGKVSREEYVEFMLKEMELVSDEQFEELHNQFSKLDLDKGGYLDKKDLKLLIAKRVTKGNNK